LGTHLQSEADFQAGLAELQARLEVRLIIVTRGPDGLSMRDQHGEYTHLPAANASEVYDTTGAGDTFIAVVTLGLAAGFEPLLAAQFANTAAALVVRKLGNAVVSPSELVQAMQRHTDEG
jgi:bifunctional ADP-heptose synthase (sugar kinase/adenylyltransferase)